MIACIPNISEGKDRRTVEVIVGSLGASGCRVLDVHVDPDHNRSVVTIVGEEASLREGIVALVRDATSRIDLRSHRGVHPRIGAVDVLPFVPLRGATMSDGIRLAREVGRTIGEELEIPVFLYADAATSPVRRELAAIRRGEFEGLETKLQSPDWLPDFGPDRPHPTAGAIAIGARGLLVAYNVLLNTDDLAIARRVAAAVREHPSGLAGVRALGLPLRSRGLVQVSMNLTDPEATGLASVYARVEEEARRLGVSVVESEIVGLVPRAAAAGASTESLRLRRALDGTILEERLTSRWA